MAPNPCLKNAARSFHQWGMVGKKFLLEKQSLKE